MPVLPGGGERELGRFNGPVRREGELQAWMIRDWQLFVDGWMGGEKEEKEEEDEEENETSWQVRQVR